jgi:hypothetical protein
MSPLFPHSKLVITFPEFKCKSVTLPVFCLVITIFLCVCACMHARPCRQCRNKRKPQKTVKNLVLFIAGDELG